MAMPFVEVRSQIHVDGLTAPPQPDLTPIEAIETVGYLLRQFGVERVDRWVRVLAKEQGQRPPCANPAIAKELLQRMVQWLNAHDTHRILEDVCAEKGHTLPCGRTR
jgi:hypothetical protein